MSLRLRPVVADLIGTAPREFVLEPDAAARAALAARMGIPAVHALRCRFVLSRSKVGTVVAAGELTGQIVQEDINTLEPFPVTLREAFRLRFLPEDKLSDWLDPDDPEDEVGYTGATLDLEEAMAEQLALSLDPYPHMPGAPPPSFTTDPD